MTLQNSLKRPLPISLLWGLVGGICLLLAFKLTTRGPYQVTPYPFILVAAILTYTLLNKANRQFNKFFTVSFMTFIIMSAIYLAYIWTFINPGPKPFIGIAVSIGLVIGIAAASSIILALLVSFFYKKK